MSGIIEPKTLRTEQYEFKARTTDPATTETGEYWIRTDQTSSNPQVVAELRRQNTSGVSKIPLFADSEEANLGSQMVRGPSVVLDDGTVGFVAMASDSGAQFGSPRVVTAAGTEYLSHGSLILSAIPDTVTSRPADDSSKTGWTRSVGLVINPNSRFTKVGARISSMTVGATRARLYDYGSASYIESVDISGLSSGDAFSFGSEIASGKDYGIELDASGNGYEIGYHDNETAYPYTGEDIDIVARSQDGSQLLNEDVVGVNDVGSSGL